jgi:hypothetical protein
MNRVSRKDDASGASNSSSRPPVAVQLILSIALCLWLSGGLHAQQSKPTEYAVKATFLYNFGKFVQWPASAASAKGNVFFICVMGNDPFGPTLDTTIAGEQIDGRNVVAKRISTVQEAQECRILFIGLSEAKTLMAILGSLHRDSILTVSDIPHFAEKGGMIEFRLEQNRVRFQINLESADTANLSVSSELLKIAAAVIRNRTTGD